MATKCCLSSIFEKKPLVVESSGPSLSTPVLQYLHVVGDKYFI